MKPTYDFLLDKELIHKHNLEDITGFENVLSTTYSDLITLINENGLIAGSRYLITDFAQAYNIFDGGTNTVIEAQIGEIEQLVVRASSTSTLERIAVSPAYPNDIIYYDVIGKDVMNDIGYSDGAGTLVTGFKGVIEFRHDTKQNVSTWYDFRNIKFRRWAVDAVAYDVDTAYTAKNVCKSSDGKIYKCIKDVIANQGDPSVNTTNWIVWMDITNNVYVSWTYDNSRFDIGYITTTNLIFNSDVYQDVYTFGDWYQHVNNVEIGKIDLSLIIDSWTYYSTLNNIIFVTNDYLLTCKSNEFSYLNFNMTFGNGCNSNIFGNECNSNIFGDYCNYNTFGNSCVSNIFGNECNYNTFGNECNYNTFGNSCGSNTFGNVCGSNTFGNVCSSNTFGNGCVSNIFGNECNSNTFGNSCGSNTFGNVCGSNTFGNSCYSNIFGDSCISNTFGYNCISNILENYCNNLIFQNQCTFNTNTAPTGLQNCTFESGVSITGIDFTSATHIKAAYNKTIFTNSTGGVKLRYIDGSGVMQVVDVNA